MQQIHWLKRLSLCWEIKLIIIACIYLFFNQPQIYSNNRLFSSLDLYPASLSERAAIQPPEEDYYNQDFLRFGDFVYQNNIKSILFSRKGWELSQPIIEMKSDETLLLAFDDLDADHKSYAYTIIHCDALWNPSNLMEYEYIEGFTEALIDDYAFSRNTRMSFTNYRLEFPNTDMRPRISGNYILKVFVDGNPDEAAFTRRFMVYEQNITISATVKQATNLNYRDTHQEIDFTINTNQYVVSNPYRDLKVLIMQNGRWDNAIYGIQPRLVQGNVLTYDYEENNLFRGGNEFRNFDTKSLKYRTLNIESITAVKNGWEVELLPDRNRQFLRYTSQGDINGKLLIKTEDYNDDVLEADYAWIQFYLPVERPILAGNVYVLGELTDWNLSGFNKMEYNYQASRYELRLLLKQGFYDYQYAYLEDGNEVADVSVFEGTHSVTENNYSIYVYHRKPGDLYDSLIGLQHVSTGL